MKEEKIMLTLDELKEALPKHLKSAASQDLTDKLNALASDNEMAGILRENVIGWTQVLKDGKFKTEDYLKAVAYVSFKMMGHSNQEAYKRSFPERYRALVAQGADDKVISSYVAAYNKGKLVTMMMEQALVPTWLLNADVYQEAINVQANLMRTAHSEKVRVEAANSLLTHLKRPETKKLEIDIGAKESAGMEELKNALLDLAQRQQELIAQGITTREIAHQQLIESEAKDVTPVE